MNLNPYYAGQFDVIYLDPPWKYGSRGARGGKFGELDYADMTLADLKAMPVGELLSDDAALFMWTTSPFIGDAITLGQHWGLKYIRVDRVWAKVKESGARHGVCGPWGMTDTEFLLLFTKGKMHRHQAVTNQWTMCWQEPYPGRHSAKPTLFRDEITARFPDATRLEMFAREAVDGWQVWGNEAPGCCPVFHVEQDDPTADLLGIEDDPTADLLGIEPAVIEPTTHVVSFSGGRTSAYLVHLMEQKRKEEGWDVHYVFMDTGAEHPDTYRFVKEVVRQWGIPLVCLRADIDPRKGKGGTYRIMGIDECCCDLEPWKAITKKYGTPYIRGSFCTDRMKLMPYKKYCDETFGAGNYTTWLGIRVDEPKRLNTKPGYRYLAELSDFDKQDVLDWWKGQPFDLCIEEHLGNCVFCIKKSIWKVALAARDEPELAEDFHNMITSPDVRIVETRKSPSEVMYRGNTSFGQIIQMFPDASRDDLRELILKGRRYDTGSCTESCEIIAAEDVDYPVDDPEQLEFTDELI